MTLEHDSIERWSDVVDGATRACWPLVASAAPVSSVLVGGTALAMHLRHRRSRDLDVFVHEPFEPEAVLGELRRDALVAVDNIAAGTLNCNVEGVGVQFLWARGQTSLETGQSVSGLTVGSLPDVAATKLKAIGDRGELRDYYDLMRIETDAGVTMETTLRLYSRRFGTGLDHTSVPHIVRAIGSFTDVAPDPWLAESVQGLDRADATVDAVQSYWSRRQPEIADWLTARMSRP
ncbi:MAG: nucleotidyl transferase AbiEii/AbiGii toxin family protein [Acidimicrobiaceae bacterium]|nr:nucleotidyl transferase AbiEii/AbiGii toxin family protein [Acidimicrobiaceae bacterium]MXZ99351.1 nucleotidyl transferase AbiEii/AbiGii toxin family protein [Acidimicrobiaceae bacterium]MYE76261.1 nucleotidyl transferase AbiEii/AbiGii toxin family protein [Acidimicrobiaceae bacterium]MYE96200.1 nucleotidyl transferase AbiEii/AbiGii toxin family protein [Acidimicrobiaceae bacterium]MYH43714.1 nucleotidyl transferase AbiEii/AbiGii toxin family protein [Acidimicrobiaceae bacterium]